jgi:UDP-N-acetylglucosamine 2-epimerase (non-hydrolysing)/UDP-GlcNAc3NAcA epimerase
VTLRDRTEWAETVATGWNTLADLDADAARAALEQPLPAERPPLYGDGRAGERVVAALSGMIAA